MRLPDGAVTTDASGRTLTLEAHDVPVLDARASGDTVPATVSVAIRWKGAGGRRRVVAASPAFDGRIFRRARARGSFAAVEEGFAFASATAKPVRALFAELGAERNGSLAALPACAPCARP
ncbi:MAG TPA: hypothetical protein VFD84_14365 [Candidatus Binatia bacterium]|nr:hypothetical protein [Candidatus Binatia bacterium]